MKVYYINLDRSPDRKDQFLATNEEIAEFERFSAVDGKLLNEQDLIAQGVVAEPLESFSPRAFGSALSHKALWEKCLEWDQPITIAEDDTCFNRGFSQKAVDLLDRLPSDWHIVRWGWNFDSVLDVNVLPGLKDGILQLAPAPLGEQVGAFQQLDYEVSPIRLNQVFGLLCYTVSPAGARRLLEACFPLKNELVTVRGLGRTVLATSIDTMMNEHYGSMKAYVCFPPLVWSDNIKGGT